MLIVGGAGGVVALVVAYRNQGVREEESGRQRTVDFTRRYEAASAMMGHERSSVRLAGVYALAGLADEWFEQRQQCIDVLCRFLRLPYDPVAPEVAGQREVRLAVIKVIADHLKGNESLWRGFNLDFEGVLFDGGDFSGANFGGNARVIFDRATFNVSEGHVWFREAVFSSTDDISFDGAKFVGGSVLFEEATFGSKVRMTRADFQRGEMSFKGARFEANGDLVTSGQDIPRSFEFVMPTGTRRYTTLPLSLRPSVAES
jgi:hypothetical protein